MQSSQDMISKYVQKDRSPAVRDRPRLTVPLPTPGREPPPVCHTPPTPASSTGDLRPKGILKKTNSNMDSSLLPPATPSTAGSGSDGEPPPSPLSVGRPCGTPPDPDTAL